MNNLRSGTKGYSWSNWYWVKENPKARLARFRREANQVLNAQSRVVGELEWTGQEGFEALVYDHEGHDLKSRMFPESAVKDAQDWVEQEAVLLDTESALGRRA